jgi:hypothetical protein
MAAVVAPPLDTVAVIDASAAVSRPTLQSEPAPPQPSPPTVHDTPIAAPMHAPTQARPRSSPMDEFGGRR